jgi:hypothetical protein
MLKRFCFLMSLVFLVAMLSGCSKTLNASLDSQFTLSPGQSARISSESMDIKFIGVTADSRCPKGVECIWAGEVTCDIEITKDGVKDIVQLKTVAPTDSSWGNTFQKYWLLFDVTPYPEAGKTIDKSEYRLLLTVKFIPN